MVENDEAGDTINMTRHKIVFVGDIYVGKTAIINRFIENKYRENYESSIGVDFCSKNLRYQGRNIKLQIWDSAGQERYKSLIPTYIRGASIIFIVFDISKRESFNSVVNWISFIKDYENCLIVLCANKIDLEERKVETSEAEKLANKEGLLYFEVSAKTNQNLRNMFYSAIVELPIFYQTPGDESNKLKIINDLQIHNESQMFETSTSNPKGIHETGVCVRGKKPKSGEKNGNSCKC